MEESAQEMVQARPILTPELQRGLAAAVQTTGGFCSAVSHCEQPLSQTIGLVELTQQMDAFIGAQTRG